MFFPLGPIMMQRNNPMEGNMSVITRILDSIDNLLYSQEIRRREAYLAQAQNAQDLEARMRKVDSDYWRPIL
jgi:hypothetical protein